MQESTENGQPLESASIGHADADNRKVGAIVVAAGSGSRIGAPKQFLELTPGTRMVDRAVQVAATVAEFVVVVLPAGTTWDGAAVYATCEGGSDRLSSVASGLAALPEGCDVVLVHDAAHPLASAALARACVSAIRAGASGVVPLLEAVDIVKRRDASGNVETVGRSDLGAAQVPMAFDRAVLDSAHAQRHRLAASPNGPVEDSQLLEALGWAVASVPGEVANVHLVDEASLAVIRACCDIGHSN